MTQFKDFGLAAPILKALDAEGYSTPTPIQTQAIPIVLNGRDLVGLAQTGTGKTAAFALPILHRLHANRKHAGEKSARALVLAPTRELAGQIANSFRAYGRFLGLSTAVVYGGASMFKQKQALYRGVDILVATPGRLLDHVSQRSVRLDNVEILVLDEADHMLDMGFIHDLRKIAGLVPKHRQTPLLLRHHAGAHRRPGRAIPEQPRTRRGRPAVHDGGAGRAGSDPRRRRHEAGAAARASGR